MDTQGKMMNWILMIVKKKSRKILRLWSLQDISKKKKRKLIQKRADGLERKKERGEEGKMYREKKSLLMSRLMYKNEKPDFIRNKVVALYLYIYIHCAMLRQFHRHSPFILFTSRCHWGKNHLITSTWFINLKI